MVEQWSAGDQWRVETNCNGHRYRYTCNQSMPKMSPVVPSYYVYIHYNNQVCKGNHFDWQVPEQRSFPQAPYNPADGNNPNFLHVLDSYSSTQAITETSLNAILEYNGSDKAATILWLDHIKMVAENTGIDNLKVGISKLKALALDDITTIHKDSHLTW